MNEQIEKIFNESYKEILRTNALGKPYSTNEFDPQKFAELIVKECSTFVYNYPEKYLTRPQAIELCLAMEEYFGVEK